MVALRWVAAGLLVGASGSVAQTPVKREIQQHIEKVTSCLPPPVTVKGEPPACTTLEQRMAELHVNGLSIAVVHRGIIEWAQGFGVAGREHQYGVDQLEDSGEPGVSGSGGDAA
jgi:CubicO group peptidase (beta-lactamase class C family)